MLLMGNGLGFRFLRLTTLTDLLRLARLQSSLHVNVFRCTGRNFALQTVQVLRVSFLLDVLTGAASAI
jgi:hypothetical protein